MNMKIICAAAGLAMMMAGCNETKNEAAVVETKNVAAQPAVQPAPQPAPAAPAAQVPQLEAQENSVTPNGVIVIGWQKALELKNDSGAFVVDVRNPPELNEGYLTGSVNIPLGELKNRLSEIPKDKKVVLYCRSGRRSQIAANLLRRNDYEQVYNVSGGFLAYPGNK